MKELNNSNLLIGGKDKAGLESVDTRMICFMRVVLAVSALAITYIDPTEPDRLVELTYGTLVLFCLYSLVLYYLSIKNTDSAVYNFIHWVDIGWYLILVALSNGTSSIFFFFFFFSILVSAFRFGFEAGIRITLVSAVLFSIIGYYTAPSGEHFELNRFFLRPIYLAILGYMISYWGGLELRFSNRLALLKDLNRLSNPRFGIDQTLSSILNRLLDFYNAETCLLIIKNPSSAGFSLREATRELPGKSLNAEHTEAATPLNNIPDKFVMFYQKGTAYLPFSVHFDAVDGLTGESVNLPESKFLTLADLFDSNTFLTVPIYQHGELLGRIYLTADRNCFDRSDMDFIRQMMDHLLPVIENIDLLDRLASEAAERQRQKISRDIHDSTIQPYIGLKLGLEAVELKYANGESIGDDLDKLINLAETGIRDLRGYIKNLQGEKPGKPGSVLIGAVKQQAIKYQEFYGIKVDVQPADGFFLNDRLAAEAFQIITESLSNIKRHTKAKNAVVKIHREFENLVLEITNENPHLNSSDGFFPKSIAGRAKELGGITEVDQDLESGITRVKVVIPL